MKVAVVGSRNLNLDISPFIPPGTSAIVSGGAKGIDSLAEYYADQHGLQKIIFKPLYNRYGKRAPLIRNTLIVNEADMIVAIWDGSSRGTKFTIDYARKMNKSVNIHIVK